MGPNVTNVIGQGPPLYPGPLTIQGKDLPSFPHHTAAPLGLGPSPRTCSNLINLEFAIQPPTCSNLFNSDLTKEDPPPLGPAGNRAVGLPTEIPSCHICLFVLWVEKVTTNLYVHEGVLISRNEVMLGLPYVLHFVVKYTKRISVRSQ